jgi:hypothetical protein
VTSEPLDLIGDERRRAARTGTNARISWLRPVDLAPFLAGTHARPQPTVGRRDDRQALFYEQSINLLFGDSGSGKSLFLLWVIAQSIAAGNHAVYLDFEDTPESIVSRLLTLGARPDDIAERFHYFRPTDPLTIEDVDLFVNACTQLRPAILVIDSLGEAFGLEGINENADNEVGPWLRRVARRIADAGPAVVLVDHVTKAGESPLHPSGSKRKRAAVGGASYRIDAIRPLTADDGGRLRIVCAKDRHGWYRRGEAVADFVLAVDVQSTRAELYAPTAAEDRTHPIERAIVAVLAEANEAISKNTVGALVRDRKVKASDRAIADALTLLATRGQIIETAGQRGSRLFGPAEKAAT